MRFLISAVLIVIGIQSQAKANILNSTTCSINYSISNSGSTDCSIAGPGDPQARASATSIGSVTLPDSASGTLSLAVNQSVESNAGWTVEGFVDALATATSTIHVNLYTEGAMRDGWVQVSSASLWERASEGFTGHAALSLGDYYGGCGDDPMATCYFGNILLGDPSFSYRFPFTLGSSFELDFTQTFYADANPFTGWSHSIGQTAFNFEFFEADGSTPVMVYDPPGPASAPEPATFLLAALPLLGILGLRKLVLSRVDIDRSC